MEERPTVGSSTDSESGGVLHRPVTGRLISVIGRILQDVGAGLETKGDEQRRNTTAAPNVNDSARTASKEVGPTTLRNRSSEEGLSSRSQLEPPIMPQ